MTEEKELEYKDSKGRNYKLGDIVFNPCFGDFWLVEEYTKEERDYECPYCFSLYGSKDEYYMDLDEPVGFEIVCSKGEPDYDQYIKEFKEIIKKRKEQEAEWEKENQS